MALRSTFGCSDGERRTQRTVKFITVSVGFESPSSSFSPPAKTICSAEGPAKQLRHWAREQTRRCPSYRRYLSTQSKIHSQRYYELSHFKQSLDCFFISSSVSVDHSHMVELNGLNEMDDLMGWLLAFSLPWLISESALAVGYLQGIVRFSSPSQLIRTGSVLASECKTGALFAGPA
ncbi:hypothetical protein MHYP_G00329880 [Metynnis hypsauchen]